MVARLLTLSLIAAFSIPQVSSLAADQLVRAATARQTVDRFAVPDGGVAELVSFVNTLQHFRPKTAAEFAEQRKRFPGAIQTAAKRILALESDRQSDAARKATAILLEFRIQQLPKANKADQRAALADLRVYLRNAPTLTKDDLALAFQAAESLQCCGSCELACEAYRDFGERFASHDDEAIARHGTHMLGLARRLAALGKPLEIDGVTFSGEAFDWSQYRGKVVLVDFWATWCRNCNAELANIERCYQDYHERGFEVVGVSLDRDRQKLGQFLATHQLPWVTLFEEGAGWGHPLARHYGITEVPTLMLVDQTGKVIALDASGSELKQQLDELLAAAR